MKMINRILISVALLLAFLLLIVVLLKVDVGAVGAGGTNVGLSGFNVSVRKALGTEDVNGTLDKVTDCIMYASFALAGIFGVLGLAELIRRKSLIKVDSALLGLCCLYVLTGACYFVFEKFPVNFRPVLMPESIVPEASFPSSHVLFGCVIFGSAIILLGVYRINQPLRLILQVVLTLLALALIAGRLLSGVHWATDVLGGVLLSAFLLSLYAAFLASRKKLFYARGELQ